MCTIVRIERAFFPIAAVAFALEAALFSTLSAMLPQFESEFGMSTLASGVLAGCYTAGMVLAILVTGLWAGDRFGVRATSLAGCVLLALASVAFGAANDVVTLDVARTVQGVGAGLLWYSLLNWLILIVPPARRGSTLGAALGASVFGTAAGPLLGAATQVVGTFVVFAGVAAVVLLFAAVLQRAPAPTRVEGEPSTSRLRLPPDTQLRLMAAIAFVPPLVISAVLTIVPLQLVARGASELGVDAALLAGALLAAICCPKAGRISDRRGALAPVVFGGVISVATLAAMAASHSPLMLSIGFVLFEGIGLSFFWIPIISLFTERGEAVGIGAATAALTINLTFTVASTVGPPLLSALEQLTTEAAPYLAMAATCLLTLAVIVRRRSYAARPAEIPAGEVAG
ncbi:MAG: MFS transporter [Solirubrobacterales bacterium]